MTETFLGRFWTFMLVLHTHRLVTGKYKWLRMVAAVCCTFIQCSTSILSSVSTTTFFLIVLVSKCCQTYKGISCAPCVLAYQSRTRRPQMLVLRMPTVGRATLENRNLLTSTSGRLSCRFAIDCSLIKLKTSRYISELTDDKCLQ